jgi:hypothetical protein
VLVRRVFEHLECTNEVEPSSVVEIFEFANDPPAPRLVQPLTRLCVRSEGRLDPDVLIRRGEPHRHRPTTGPDLQNRFDVGEFAQQTPNDVMAQPTRK